MGNLSFKSIRSNSKDFEIFNKEEFEMDSVNNGKLKLITREERINDIRFLNKYFEQINTSLMDGGIFGNLGETLEEGGRKLLVMGTWGLKFKFFLCKFQEKALFPQKM